MVICQKVQPHVVLCDFRNKLVVVLSVEAKLQSLVLSSELVGLIQFDLPKESDRSNESQVNHESNNLSFGIEFE